ncbi:MAG: leucine-rich repeat domain-containing protein, partial [Deltaproteobacteria bacterium]|nr:leucine-rich repeat domain-containing protein [Deltaproteobacteria bacterium]
LIERDDPRGELINIDLALEARSGDEVALNERRAEILAHSAPKLLGDVFARVVADGYGTVTWRRGFVDQVKYRGDRHLGHLKSVGWLIKLMTTVHEPFSLLRSLDLSYTDVTDVRPLLKFRHLATLRIDGCNPTPASLEALRAIRSDLEVLTERDYSMNDT